jgi:hypothetical protein
LSIPKANDHVELADGDTTARLGKWRSAARTGGGALLWYGQLSRFRPSDFSMGSPGCGVRDTELRDWPIHRCVGWARDEVLPKLGGLSEYDMRRPMTSTGTNLLGLVKNLAFYEATYFGVVFRRPYPHAIPTVDASFRNLDSMGPSG